MSVFLAISPVILIFLLMTWGRRTADVAGLIGWVYTALLAALVLPHRLAGDPRSARWPAWWPASRSA